MKIVVANSVGVDSNGYHMVHVPSRWSLGVKNFTNCGYYPWELAYTSSLLKRETSHDVKFLDGALMGWDFQTYFSKLEEEKPDWLIMESSTRTLREDLRLAKAAKEAFGTRLIFTGQHPMADPETVLKTADYVCIGEYEFAVLDLINGKNSQSIPGIYPNPRGDLIDIRKLPFPEDDDIRRIDYHEPNCRYRQIQMYASRGCPRRCNFCAAATLYYDELNWRPRDVDNVVDEIRTLREKYPEMEGVFFDEEVHNIKKSFNIALAKSIRQAGFDDLKYEAMCEYASLDKEALEEMRSAGYYKVRIGVETGSDVIAEKMTLGKKHDLKNLWETLKFSKEIGMLVYGTFSIGGLGSTYDEDRKTVELIYELSNQGLLAEIQVSINTPQPGTDFYNSSVSAGQLPTDMEWEAFDGGGSVVVSYPNYSAEQILENRVLALDAFDRGKAEFNSLAFADSAKTSFEVLSPTAKVLTLRCARPWFVELVLASLKERTGTSSDLLGQDAMQTHFQATDFVGNYYSYGSGFFAENALSQELQSRLKEAHYDAILIPSANNHMAGYQNVLAVAKNLGADQVFAVFPEGNLKAI